MDQCFANPTCAQLLAGWDRGVWGGLTKAKDDVVAESEVGDDTMMEPRWQRGGRV